jgi:DNA replication protein DnaC
VLIIDDFVISKSDIGQCNDFLELLEERERHGALIVTSQYAPDKWHERFADPTIADAICDRLINRSNHISLTGDTLRRKKGTASD